MSEEEWRDFKTDPPADGQYVRVKSIIEREAWYVPSNKVITWIGRAKPEDEKADPFQWKPIKGAQNYHDKFC
jgi:hypothetical protein